MTLLPSNFTVRSSRIATRPSSAGIEAATPASIGQTVGLRDRTESRKLRTWLIVAWSNSVSGASDRPFGSQLRLGSIGGNAGPPNPPRPPPPPRPPRPPAPPPGAPCAASAPGAPAGAPPPAAGPPGAPGAPGAPPPRGPAVAPRP